MSAGLGPARVLVVTWAPGGNLPPLLAAAVLMAARGHRVEVLASAATRGAVERAGLPARSYRRTPEPDTRIAFERQAGAMLATAAGADVARDVHDVLRATRPDLVIVDCMLPAALSAAEAAGTPAASLVHFLYGPARREMLLRDSGWTTDVEQLNTTRRDLGLPALTKGLEAWERPDLVLVTAPRWLDADLEYPAHVTHAGPLGIRTGASEPRAERPRVLLSFSTTVMDGQPQAVQCICDGVAGTGMDAVLTLGPALEAATLRIPSNVEVTAWADHDALLPTCAAAITHGGLGTTLRALAHGVPLLLLPLGRDQAFNAARVAEYGAGIQIPPDAGPAAVAGAVARLLDEPGFAAAAARAAARVAADVPDQRAADTLEACARPEIELSAREHAPQNAMTDPGEIARFHDRCSDLMHALLHALAEAPDRPRPFPEIEDALGWPRRRIASVLGGVWRLRQTEFAGRRPYRFLDERQSASGRWEMWMDAAQARALRAARCDS